MQPLQKKLLKGFVIYLFFKSHKSGEVDKQICSSPKSGEVDRHFWPSSSRWADLPLLRTSLYYKYPNLIFLVQGFSILNMSSFLYLLPFHWYLFVTLSQKMPKKETWSKFKITVLRKLDWGTYNTETLVLKAQSRIACLITRVWWTFRLLGRIHFLILACLRHLLSPDINPHLKGVSFY